ncbi:MAG: formylglycine-generating enzyme family protein, partial [Planctomycetota bacterium]
PKEDTHWRDCLLSSTPAHRVVVSKPFYLAVNETTQAEFKAILGRNPAWYAASGPEPYYVDRVKGEDTSRHPVEGVTWKDAQEFAQKLASSELGQIVGLAAFRSSRLSEQACSSEFSEVDCGLAGEVASRSLFSIHYRLPTDAEWEHACRGGTASPFSFGETEPVAMGWFGEANGGRTWEVGRGEVNPLGLYGVHTGVWEWVEDHWSVPEYGQYRDWPVLDPRHSAGTPLPHVVRGGMWPDRRSRSFDRYAYDADFQTFFVGFRLVLDLPAMPD